VFERFTERARQVIVHAQEEARWLCHGYIGAEHILLGVVRVERGILPAGVEDIRARIGKGTETTPNQIPFTSGAKATLERTLREAHALGHTRIVPAHLLLAVADEPEAVLASGASRERIRSAAMLRLEMAPPPRPFDVDATIAAGGPVAIWLGSNELPIGDLGNPRVDGRLLLAMLAKDGHSAALLREHGLDEAAIRDRLDP
jgi:ATP-dependent Clp protease ATP-binding subunit ClpC